MYIKNAISLTAHPSTTLTIKLVYFAFDLNTIWASARQTYNKICETSKDSAQPAHPCNLIRPLIAGAFYSLQAIQTGLHENFRHTGWMYMYRLIWVFAGRTDLTVFLSCASACSFSACKFRYFLSTLLCLIFVLYCTMWASAR